MRSPRQTRVRPLGDSQVRSSGYPRSRLTEAHDKGEVLTGLFYVNTKAPTFLDMLNMVDQPLAILPESLTRPGREALEAAMEELR